MINQINYFTRDLILVRLLLLIILLVVFAASPNYFMFFACLINVFVVFGAAMRIADMEDSADYKHAKWVDENIKGGKWTCTWEKQD